MSASSYPRWLATTSFVWVLTGWTLAALAPLMTSLLLVEGLHLLLPGVTLLLILANLAHSLYALFRRKVAVDQLLVVTALQMGLFTTLFYQLSAHLGAIHYWLEGPTQGWQWIQFSLAHALRASDVLDSIEAFGWSVQSIKHRSSVISVAVVFYHLVIDLFMLSLFWAAIAQLKQRLLAHPGTAKWIRRGGLLFFLAWLGVWLFCALSLRPWRSVDIPLWLGENVVRVVDFADVMDSFDIHWHQVPRELIESTLTFLCRVWIAIGLSLFLTWRAARKQAQNPQATPLPEWRNLRGLAVAAVLMIAVVGLDAALATQRPQQIRSLIDSACGDMHKIERALAALRRLGPNAEEAIEPLVTQLSTRPYNASVLLLTLSHLGPNAAPALGEVARDFANGRSDEAVRVLEHIGPSTAPILVEVWRKQNREHTLAGDVLTQFGLNAMPYLLASTNKVNAKDHLHWFNQLDRNWTLRSTKNETVEALKRLQANPDVRKLVRERSLWLPECGSAIVVSLIRILANEEEPVRSEAASVLGKIGPAAKDAVPALTQALKDKTIGVRSKAAEALGTIGPEAKSAVAALERMSKEDPDSAVRKVAVEALEKIRKR